MAENEPTHPPDSGSPPPKAVIRQIVSNVRLARALSIVAELGIADFVADAPKSAAELATATGAHADSLYRLPQYCGRLGTIHYAPHCDSATRTS
ncbi:MAG: hypothetical protein V3T19_10795, partial [Acidiferrobacterales bacterium]